MRRVLIISAVALAVLLSIPAIAMYWLCYTESGLQWIAGRAQGLKKASIALTGVTGTLAGPIHVDRLVLDHPRVRIVADDIDASINLADLWLQTIQINRATAASMDVQLRRRPTAVEKREPKFLPAWLRVRTNELEVRRARLQLQNGMAFDASPVRAQATLTTDELEVGSVFVGSEKVRAGGIVIVRAREPIALEGTLDWQFVLPEQPRYAGRATFEGDLADLAFKGILATPFSATATGNAVDLTGDWNWKADVRTAHFDLKPWQPESALGAFAATLSATGNRENINVSGRIAPQKLDTGPIEVSFEGGYEKKRLRTDNLLVMLERNRAQLQAHGEFLIDGGIPTTRLSGRWSRLQWPLRGKPVARSPTGTFSVDGDMPFRLALSGDVESGRFASATFNTRAVLDRGRLSVQSFDARALAGALSGQGELSWSPAKTWRVQLQGNNLDPQVIHEAFPGRVAFRLAGAGAGFDAESTWDLTLGNLRGELRSQPISGRARVRHEGRTYRISNADVRFGGARLVADGIYGPVRDLHVELVAEDLARVIPEARGVVMMRADLDGDDDAPHLSLSLNASALEYQRYRVQRLTAEGNLDLSDRQASRLDIEAVELGLEERRLRSVRIGLDGRASDHQLTVGVNAGNLQVDLHTKAGYAREEWQGILDGLTVTVQETKLAMTAPAKYFVSRERAEIAQFCLADQGQRVCGQGRWTSNGPWNVQAQATNLPLKMLAAGLARPLEYSGALALDARASGAPGELWTGVLRADFSDGVFRYRRASGKVQSMTIGTGRAQFTADAQHYSARVNLRSRPAARIRGEAQAQRRPGADWRKLPLAGSVDAETQELNFLPILVPQIDRASGKLHADLTLDGTLGAPRIDGALELTDGELDLFAINLMLREVGVTVDLAGNSLDLSAHARAGEGKLAVTGDLAWNERLPKGTMRLTGENLVMVDVPEARIVASPNLRFRVDGRHIDVDGAVRVPAARLAPANLTGAALPSEDEIIVGEKQTPAGNRFNVTTGIHLILGDDVGVDSYGLTGQITGGVLAYSASGEVSTGIGEIGIAEGKYTFYGRELDIEHGRLVFSGGPLSDPGVDLRAVRKYPDVLAGVNVRGTLRAPRVSFFSDPPLPQTQIVSILVAGRTLDSIQDEGPTSGGGASGATLLAQGGALIASRLGEQLGINLDEVSVESETGEDTSLVLGKFLSPRLYVSYGISLTESINTFKLRYTISDHWTIKTEAGEARAADIVFTIDR